MAEAAAPSLKDKDRDLASIAQARALARRARQAWLELAEFSQERIDAVVDAMAAASKPCAEAFARLAVEETGYGVVEDKIQKNLFASVNVYEWIRPIKTVGIVARHDDKKLVEIAEPFGPVAAIVPSTNPTSTALYKILIAVKARCSIVLSPHPAAVKCITAVAECMAEAARHAGAPDGTITWMTDVTLEGTQELMKQREIAVILATGGMGLVRAAYSAGKPAYGVGPGNAPAFIERTADLKKAVRDVITGKTFDNGVLCSSENSVVVDQPVESEVRRAFEASGCYFMSKAEIDAVARALVTPQRLPNPALVGKSAAYIAEKCGISVPRETKILIAPLEGVGRDYPLSIEKLCPVLSYYVVRDWREGCERCKQILRYGGMGHTMAIHSQDEQIILEFGLKKPAFRVMVNQPATFGSIGLTSGLDPAMTLGCGGFGGNITSDNIAPRHLLNIKRLAYEVRAVPNRFERAGGAETRIGAAATFQGADTRVGPDDSLPALPKPPARPQPAGISADALTRRIDQFLESRGYRPSEAVQSNALAPLSTAPMPAGAATPKAETPLDFVCEDDVRAAVRRGQKLLVSERAIITPAARDLGETHKVFTVAPWRG